MDAIAYAPIGWIRSPFRRLEDIPSPPDPGSAAPAVIELKPEFAEGLRDLGGFSHILVLYHLDRAGQPRMVVAPPRDTAPHGVFATRAPARPNPIGVAVARLDRIEGVRLFVDRMDALEGTPVLDIKPWLPDLRPEGGLRLGWLERASIHPEAP